MKTKLLIILLAGCLCALAAWLVHTPTPAQVDEVPEKYRDTVRKGLEYLVKQQHKDGHWEGDAGKHPVAMTGLVGLALLMEKDDPLGADITRLSPVRAAAVRRAADWLMEQSDPKRDGLIFSGHASETSRYMEGHGLATMFLAGACRQESDDKRQKKLRETLTRAVQYIARAQSSQGGWYHTSKAEGHDLGDILATVIQVQALQAAENASVAVPRDVMRDGQAFLKAQMGEKETTKPGNALRSAAALAAYLEWDAKVAVPGDRDVKFSRDELLHFYSAQLANRDKVNWKEYREKVFDQVQKNQNKDGSWPAGDGIGVGSVYSAAIWCTVLQLDHGSYPAERRYEALVTQNARTLSVPFLQA